ncbi:MAG: hypothetical protein J6P44_07910 [Bacteroidales bacterium]|nr:hypothetical protein [Bacteroidales bacterium]
MKTEISFEQIELAFEHLVQGYLDDSIRADHFDYVVNPLKGQERENLIKLGKIIAWVGSALHNLGKELKDKSPDKYKVVEAHRNEISISNNFDTVYKVLEDLLKRYIIY